MIFVTVGTHEQQFNRLVKAMDDLVANGTITEPVFEQTGYSTYIPEHCEHSQFVPAQRMQELMSEASVVITHGGPSSFVEAMSAGRALVVVPRRAEFGEHVNDHQADFVRIVAERIGGIVPVFDVGELPQAIAKAREMTSGEAFKSHNAEFCHDLTKLIEGL
jgi:UDP-N-acetylglucosamine transferase subunit ALG13